jgi:hypothetical protein
MFAIIRYDSDDKQATATDRLRMGEQMSSTQVASRKRQRSVTSIAPALVLLAQQVQAKQAAQHVGVSAATILNWMDWAFRHHDQVESYLIEHYPDLTQAQRDVLWTRIARRRAKRERRVDFEGLLSKE